MKYIFFFLIDVIFQLLCFFSYEEYMYSFFYKISDSNILCVPFIDLKLYIVFILNMQFIFEV